MNPIGLVLEGGGMRGLFTAGVMDVMLENDFQYTALVGVSAGACFGCNYKSKQIGRVLRYNTQYCQDARFCSVRSLLKTGNLFGAEFAYYEIPERLDLFDWKTYEENPMAFYLVCTDVETGKPIYHRCDSLREPGAMEWMRASASLPLVSQIVDVDGKMLLDGGISDAVPLRYIQSLGCDRNVVVLTQPAGYEKKPASMMFWIRRKYRQYPALVRAMETRHEMYNETIRYVRAQEQAGNTFVICPPEPLSVGRVEHDPDVLRKTYAMGRAEALKRMDALKAFYR